MQSIVVYGSRYTSVSSASNKSSTSYLAINLLKTLINQYTNKSNFLHEKSNTILDKLKYLLNQSNGYSKTANMPLLSIESQDLITRKFHLITAHSGYSKDYLNTNFNTNIQNKKGVIGDDAWFIAKQKCMDVLGVADGVGGWHDMGIDPSRFSFNLMKTCKRIVEQEYDLSINQKTPINLLAQSYKTLLESKNNSLLIGSSTACILLFHHDTNLLHTCNLGDSGFCVIRDNRIIHRSQEQQHYFNSPYQIAILPSLNLNNNIQMTNRQENNESLFNDSPESAATSSIQLNEGDFILVATDGLWDNLTESQLLIEISKIKVNLK